MSEKIARCADADDDVSQLVQVQAGRFFEPSVAAWFADAHKVGYKPGPGLLQHDTVPYLGATCDFILDDGRPLETKVIGFEVRANFHANSTPTKGWPKDFDLPVPVEIVTAYPTTNLQVAKADVGTARGEFRQALQDLYKQFLPALGAPCAPIKYVIQLYVQLAVLGKSDGWISAAVGGTTRIDVRYERDALFEEFMLEQCADFWREVVSGRDAMSAVGF